MKSLFTLSVLVCMIIMMTKCTDPVQPVRNDQAYQDTVKWAMQWLEHQKDTVIYNERNKAASGIRTAPISCEMATQHIMNFETDGSNMKNNISSAWLDISAIKVWLNHSMGSQIDGMRVYLTKNGGMSMLFVATKNVGGVHTDFFKSTMNPAYPEIYNYNDPCPPAGPGCNGRNLREANACNNR